MSSLLENRMKIELDSPKRRLKHETMSKFLKEQSDLYFFIKDCQDRIKHSGFRIIDKLEPCVEILNLHERGKADEMWMYPVEPGVARADVMKFAPEPAKADAPTDQDIADKGAAWVARWTQVVLK